jgi:hypothetical protein
MPQTAYTGTCRQLSLKYVPWNKTLLNQKYSNNHAWNAIASGQTAVRQDLPSLTAVHTTGRRTTDERMAAGCWQQCWHLTDTAVVLRATRVQTTELDVCVTEQTVYHQLTARSGQVRSKTLFHGCLWKLRNTTKFLLIFNSHFHTLLISLASVCL